LSAVDHLPRYPKRRSMRRPEDADVSDS